MAELKVPFHKAAITKDEEDAVLEVLRSGWLTTGKWTLEFENQFTKAVTDSECLSERKKMGLETGNIISLAVNSNTSGMILAMEACGVKQGKAVITTPYTFVSTAACARHLNGDVLFADIEKESYSIDPEKIEEILKKDTESGEHKVCAIVPVHIAGNMCNMEKICALAKKYSTPQNKIYVIEDAAHSFPSRTKLGYGGTIGDVGVFSFYVTKTITTAEGGMVTTRNESLAKRMTTMRLHGMDRTTWDRYTSPKASWEYDIIAPGYKFNLPDVLSAIGVKQLERSKDFYNKRRAIFEKYNEAFKNLDYITLPPDGEGNACHLYPVRINEKCRLTRLEAAKKLQSLGIGISVHFIPLFHFSYWKELYPDFSASNFPNAEKQYSQTISLPIWPEMSDEDINYVIECIKGL
ncbi:MAG: DegT/DnrJ/EryC1/StrS family aminotransferase [Treponema sp.]|nr:DegT/DnrJ/EryC1/StrS family aminotransferase [Treponema sp.]